MIRRLAVLTCLACLALFAGASAQALAKPVLGGVTVSATTIAPGSELTYAVINSVSPAVYVGNGPDGTPETADDEPVTLRVLLPPGFTGVSIDENQIGTCPADVSGATVIECSGVNLSEGHRFRLTVQVDPSATGVRTAVFEMESEEAISGRWTDPVTVSSLEPGFGFSAYDLSITDGEGNALTQAATEPAEISAAVQFNLHRNPAVISGFSDPVEDVKDVAVHLPPGLLGSPASVGTCQLRDLVQGSPLETRPECPVSSQIGTISIRHSEGNLPTYPLYNMATPPGVPARFGADIVGTPFFLDAQVRNGQDYGVSVVSSDAAQGLAVAGSTVDFWGVPASGTHTPERSCPGKTGPGQGGETCESDATPLPFLRMPTSCTPAPGPVITAAADSWQRPGEYRSTPLYLHEPPGYPLPPVPSTFPVGYSGPESWGPPVGIEGCDQVKFEPEIEVQPTTATADSPSGLDVHLRVPQKCWEEVNSICQSDLKSAAVELPAGMAVNPSAATGREACSEAQIGYKQGTQAPFEFSPDPANCPNGSKIGTIEVTTPILKNPLEGTVYLAKQGENPTGSLLGMYLVAEGEGVVLKQAGAVELSASGQITTRFVNTPQAPFSDLEVSLFGGPRGVLRTPAGCGTFTTKGSLTPWSDPGNPTPATSSFKIENCPHSGFDPKFRAGSENPVAGGFSTLNLQLTREDGTQELGGLNLKLPEGLLGKLAGLQYCPEASIAAVSSEAGTGLAVENKPVCPASSEIGRITVGAGAGANPFYTHSGHVYLAGPYKGNYISLVTVTPAVAGPFDLGSVVLRNAIEVDHTTASIIQTSDPFPSILHGIPLDLRDIRVELNRPGFVINPTDCSPMAIDATVRSTTGSTADRSVPFQVSGCDRLGFKPRLKISFSGPTHRAAHPTLHAVVRGRPGDANIAATTVLLPKTELLENAHIRNVCTRVQYNAGYGGGAGCPAGSVYGFARAYTPLLGKPLEGPVYLRSNGGERELPDLVASLNGQLHVDLVGYIDSVHGRIRNRFAVVPDAPVSKFELTMQGGKKGLLVNDTELCRARPRSTALFTGQNGKLEQLHDRVGIHCKKSSRKH